MIAKKLATATQKPKKVSGFKAKMAKRRAEKEDKASDGDSDDGDKSVDFERNFSDNEDVGSQD